MTFLFVVMANIRGTNNVRILRCVVGIIRQQTNLSKNSIDFRRRLFSVDAKDSHVVVGNVTVEFRSGLPAITLPLPTNGEKCQFVLRPINQTVGDFCQHLRKEDKAVNSVILYNSDGVRLSNSTSLDNVILSEFKIQINDKLYSAQIPKINKDLSKNVEELSEIRRLVYTLYTSLNAQEEKVREEKFVADKLAEIQAQLEPLEKERQRLVVQSEKTTGRYLWLGLGLMGVQAGVLGRLTWYEYSWDIMEPVTYFVTYSSVMAGFAYFVVTRQQYEYPEAKDRMLLNKFYKFARKNRFDVNKYHELKTLSNDLELHLKRLREQSNLLNSPLENLHKVTTTTDGGTSSSSTSSDEKLAKK